MMQWLAIAGGGAVGSVLRFWVSSGVYAVVGRDFPYGTLVVNVVGAFVIGLSYVLLVERLAAAAEWRALIIVGFLGGFTTFSSFSLETLQLIEGGELLKAALNALGSVLLCVALTWVGMLAGRQL